MRSRTPFRNNARLILAIVGALLLVLGGMQLLLRESGAFTPDFLTSVLLSGFTLLNLAVFFVLLLYLGRNVVRAVMEWRRTKVTNTRREREAKHIHIRFLACVTITSGTANSLCDFVSCFEPSYR